MPPDHVLPPKPYRQGRLDGLCGVYACINAMRYLNAINHPRRRLPWRDLFYECLAHLSERWSVPDIATYGMSSAQLWSCAKHLRDTLESQHRVHTELSRPLIGVGFKSARQIFDLLEKHLIYLDHSAILGFYSDSYSHWTVLSHVSDGSVFLFDSAGARSLATRRFTYRQPETKPEANPETKGCSPSLNFTPTCLIMIRRRDSAG